MTSDERRAVLASASLYGIVDFGYVLPENAEAAARSLIEGGADVIQLRAKGFAILEIRETALKLLPICREAGVPFILNDFPEVAAELRVDGVHIGQDDGEMADAREIVGPEMIIGRSTHSLDQARAALEEGADYIGFGPLFPTPTKKGRPGIGIENIRTMEADVGGKIPAFCIGGIKLENLEEVITAGARRCVIVSSLLSAQNISTATRAAKSAIPAL